MSEIVVIESHSEPDGIYSKYRYSCKSCDVRGEWTLEPDKAEAQSQLHIQDVHRVVYCVCRFGPATPLELEEHVLASMGSKEPHIELH